MKEIQLITGFSKLTKKEKIEEVARYFQNPKETSDFLTSFWFHNEEHQKLFDEFSENTISNFHFPFGIAPNVLINGKHYLIPMVIEESSVVAAAANSAKFWSTRGGFHTRIVSTTKIGQVHFIWKGVKEELEKHFPELKQLLIEGTNTITQNMQERGGGILDIELVDMRSEIPDYYQLKAKFDTRDAMGANFINSCLEEFASILKDFIVRKETIADKDVTVIMSILSNYTPECLVEAWVECPVEEFDAMDPDMTAEEFVWKFEKAVQIATVDPHRATTHNKGIFNGIDAVVLATGNDFRAVEACGHTFAARDGQYRSLTRLNIENGIFKYSLLLPIALGTVGGLTSLHPLAKFTLELLGDPSAEDLMQISAVSGLANNFGALRSLTTKGIQKGHMKMHLLNILNTFAASEQEKVAAIEYFKTEKVSFNAVEAFLKTERK
ncbi:MAG: hydroxymethylglutaryl-CoA reductase, degradative [Bacteroidales bacterium]|jgi:hydroxymethylglutaryl-CoA reductase|nr:hydroxymethylglutaryl-CoA reductase, degradative [Bacteroidales bacterium]